MGVVIVTGGGRGIGAAVARQVAREHVVVIGYAGDHDAAGRVVADVVRLFDEAATLGPLNGVVCNAGITGNTPGRLDEQDVAVVRRVLDVNVLGVFLCNREAVRRMSTRYGGAGGAIVNISSTAAGRGSPGEWVHYAASKAAVESMTNGLAQEVAAEGIRVNAVAPGLFLTGRLQAMYDAMPEAERREVLDAIPLDRFPELREVVDPVLFLAGEEASYITGVVLDVNGGRFMPL